jgi:prolyl-tRNA synthetase
MSGFCCSIWDSVTQHIRKNICDYEFCQFPLLASEKSLEKEKDYFEENADEVLFVTKT